MKTIEHIAKWLISEIRFEWDLAPDDKEDQCSKIMNALYLARRTKNQDGDALLGRIISRLKKQEAELRGRRTDINDAKADAISTIRDELVIHRSAITGAGPVFRRLNRWQEMNADQEKIRQVLRNIVDWAHTMKARYTHPFLNTKAVGDAEKLLAEIDATRRSIEKKQWTALDSAGVSDPRRGREAK